MDGKVFNTINASDSEATKEVNSLNEFVFDLQRFTTWNLTAVQTGGEGNKTTTALKLTDSTNSSNVIELKPDSENKTFRIEAIDGLFSSGDTINVSSAIDLGDKNLKLFTAATINFTANTASLTGKKNVITIADGGDLTLKGSGSVINTEAGSKTEPSRTIFMEAGSNFTLAGATVKSEKTTDSSNEKAGEGDNTNQSGAVIMEDGEKASKFTMTSGTIDVTYTTGKVTRGVVLNGANCTFEMSGTTTTSQIIAHSAEDSAESSEGEIQLVRLNQGATFNMSGGLINARSGITPQYSKYTTFGVCAFGKASTFNMTGGTVYGYRGAAVSGNGSVDAGARGPIVKITGNSTLECTGGPAIYNPQIDGITIIGTETGSQQPIIKSISQITNSELESAIEVRGGEVIINNGTFSTDAKTYTYKSNTSGSTTAGAAVAIAQHHTGMPVKVTINGGTFSGAVGVSVANPQGNSLGDISSTNKTGPAPEVTINGGTFTGSQSITAGETIYNNVAINNADTRVVVNVKKGTINGSLTNITYKSGEDPTYTDASSTNQAFVIESGNVGNVAFDTAAHATSSINSISNIKSSVTAASGSTKFTTADLATGTVMYRTPAGSSTWTVTTLSDALTKVASGGGEIQLLANETLASTVKITNDLYIDLNGHTLTSTVATAFSVETENKTLKIKDSTTGGTLTRSLSLTDTEALVKVSKGTFELMGGTISSTYTAIDVTGGTAKITGFGDYQDDELKGYGQAAVSVTGGTATNAISVGEKGTLEIGRNENSTFLRKINPQITFETSSNAEDVAAIGGTGGTINVYGGNISANAGSNIISAVSSSGTLSVLGGTLTATGTQGYGVLYTGTAATTIDGAAITGNTYGVYNKGNATVSIGKDTTLVGNKGVGYGAVSSSSGTGTFTFIAGANIDGVQTNKDSFYKDTTSGDIKTYTFTPEQLKWTSKTDKQQTWVYTYGSGSTTVTGGDYQLASTSSTLNFTGDLFTKGVASLSADPLDVTVNDGSYTVNVVDYGNLTLKDGAIISLSGGTIGTAAVTGDKFHFGLGDLDSAGMYTATSKIDTSSGIKFYSAGADRDGFEITDSSTLDAMTFHTARDYEFEFASGTDTANASLKFWDGDNATLLNDLDEAITITKGTGANSTLKTVTINDPSKIFDTTKNSQTDGYSLKISTADYQLSIASGAQISISTANTFKNVTKTDPDAETTISSYVFTGKDGAVDSNGSAQAGYRSTSTLGVIEYKEAAKSFSFFAGSSNIASLDSVVPIAWASTNPASTALDTWFTIDTDNSKLTISSAAFANTSQQTDGAQLRFADDSNATYNVFFDAPASIFAAADSKDNTYNATAKFESSNSGIFNYTSTGMSSLAAYSFRKANGATAEAGGADAWLTYHDKASNVTLSGNVKFSDKAFSKTDNNSVSSYFKFQDGTLTILDSAAFASLDTGMTLSVDNATGAAATNYKIALSTDSVKGAEATTPAFNILDSSDVVNIIPTYANYEYRGVGASEEGWTTSDTLITFHNQYDTFTLDSSATDINIDATKFAANVLVTTPAADDENDTIGTIFLKADALNADTDGQKIKLSADSAKKYSLALDGLPSATEASADWTTVPGGTNLYNWKSDGAVVAGTVAGGYILGTTTSAVDNQYDLLTYRTKQKTAQFAVSEGDTMVFAADSIVAANISVDSSEYIVVEKGAFGTNNPENGSVMLSLASADYNGMKLGESFEQGDMAGDNRQTEATFAAKTYRGRGADSAGWAEETGNRAIVYYGEAKTFTLDGTLELNNANDSLKADSLFTVATGSIKAATINAAAIASTAEQGQTLFLANGSSDYTLAVASDYTLGTTGENTVSTARSLKDDHTYQDIGGTRAGLLAGTLEGGVNGFTYYKQQQNFSLATSESGTIGFATTPDDTVTYGTSWADSALAAAITFSENTETNTKSITITNGDIFKQSDLVDDAVLALNGSEYNLDLNISNMPDDLTSTNINTNDSISGTSGSGSFTYTSKGSKTHTGFVNDTVAGTYTYHPQSSTFNIAMSGLNFSLDAVNTTSDNGSFAANNGFTVDSANKQVIIDNRAFTAASQKDLTGSYISIGPLNDAASTQYTLVAVSEGEYSLPSASIAEASFSTLDSTPQDAPEGSTKAYAYKLKGAEKNGFLADSSNPGKLTYTAAAESFTLAGSLALADDTAVVPTYFEFDGDNVTFNSPAIFADGKRTGQFLTILNPSGEAYKLVKHSNEKVMPTANDYSKVAALAEGDGGTYVYKSKGASTAGYIDDGEGTLTYYNKRDYTITFDGTAPFNTSGLNLELTDATADSIYTDTTNHTLDVDIAVGNGSSVVTINKNVINMDSIEIGQTISLEDELDKTWKLQLASAGSASIGTVTNAYDVHSLTSSMWHGIGADSVGFAAIKDSLGAETDSFKYYGVADYFNLDTTTGANMVAFTPTVASGTGSVRAWTNDELDAAVDVTSTNKNGVTTTTFTINNPEIFDEKTLVNGATIKAASGRSAAEVANGNKTNKYALAIGTTTGWELTEAQVHTVESVALNTGSTNEYTYTFKGADKEGVLAQTDGSLVYYEESKKLTVTSDIAFDTEAINKNLDLFKVASTTTGTGDSAKTTYTLTIAAGAFDATALKNATNGATITVGTVDGDEVTLVLGTDMVAYDSTRDQGKTWTSATVQDPSYPDDTTKTVTQYKYTEAGAPANSFTGNNTATLTYVAPPNSVTFYGDSTTQLSFNDSNITSTTEDNITIDPTNKVVTISAKALAESQTAGAYLTLSKDYQDENYTLNLNAFDDSENTYTADASFSDNTYKSAGMSSKAGFGVTGNNTSEAKLVWANKADVVTFDTTGGLSFASDADTVIDAISISGTTVTIKPTILASGTTLYNNASLRIVNSTEEGATQYTLDIGDGWTKATATDASLTINESAGTGTFKSAGAKDTAGFAVKSSGSSSNNDTLIYYATPETVTFMGEFIDKKALSADSAKYITVANGKVALNKAAIDFTKLDGDGTETVEVTTKNYEMTLDGSDLTNVSGTTNSAGRFEGKTFIGVGAEKQGFVPTSSTVLTYWKAYDTFTMTDESDLTIAAPDSKTLDDVIKITTATSGSTTTKTIAIDPTAFANPTGAQFIQLTEDSTKAGYKFAATATASLTSDQIDKAASLDTSKNIYTAKGAEASGYLLSKDADQLTYYKEADKFEFVLTDSTASTDSEGTDSTSTTTIPWNSSQSAAALANFINISDGDGTEKTVTFGTNLLDTTKLKGDGTEILKLVSANTDKEGTDLNTNTYVLGTTSAWGQVTGTQEGSFTPKESGGGTLKSAGATFNSSSSTQGFFVNAGELTYYRKPAEVELTGTATFKDIPSADLAGCFTIVDSTKTVTIKEAALDYITNENREGMTLIVPTGYTLNIDAVKGAGTPNATAKLSNAVYTSAGVTGKSAKEGFQADTGSTTNYTYHKVADEVSFSGSNIKAWNSDSTAAGAAVSIETVTDESTKSTVKYVKISPAAFTSLVDSNTIKLNSVSTNKGYKLYTTIDEETKKVGDLDYAGDFNSATRLNIVTTGEGDAATKTYTYQSKGSDRNGFIVDETNGVLTYHTIRADEFTFTAANEGDTPIALSDSLTSTSALSYFSVGTASSGVKTVTISNPTSLFAAYGTQTDGATIKLVPSADCEYTYKIAMSTSNQASWNSKPTFSSSKYTFAGASKNGCIVETDGSVTYHNQAASFSFNTTGNVAKFNTPGVDTNLDEWFTFTDKKVTAAGGTTSTVKVVQIQPAAVSTTQTDGNTITLAKGTTGYELDGSALVGKNTYVANASLAATDTGYTYTSEGATEKDGFVNVTSGSGDDATTTLTYQTKQKEIAFTGTIKFNETFPEGKTLDDYLTFDGTTFTISKDALASDQENGATLTTESGYKLAIVTTSSSDQKVTTASGITPASLSGSAGNYVYKSAGASTAGYQLTNNTLTYYGNPDSVNFIGSATFDTKATLTGDNAAIKISTNAETGKKTVTVASNALTGTLAEGVTLMITDTTKYELAVDDKLDGGEYYGTLAFTKDSIDADTGTSTYTYMFGGAKKQNGFVKENSTDTYLTYHSMSSQINFAGDIGVVDGDATALVKNFSPNPTDGTVKIDTAKAFTGGYDNTTFKITSSTGSIYTKLELVDSSDVAPEGEQDASLTKSDSGYTYESAGAKTPGYRLDTSDSATVVYRAAIDTVNFEGKIVLDETKSAAGAISVKDKVVTITNDAFGTQTANADLKISGTDYTLQFAEDDKHPVWAEKDAEFNEGKTVYTTQGYSETGYQLNEGTISYRIADRVEIPFEGLADTATTTNVAFDKETATFTLGNEALKDATNLVDGANVTVTGDYKLVLENVDALKPVKTEEDFDAIESGSTTATYHNTYNTGGYEVTDDAKKIDFTKKIDKATLFTLNGVNATVEKSIVTEVKDGEYEVNIAKTNVADGATELSLAKGEGVTATYTLALTGEGMETEPTVETTNDFGTVDETAHTVDYVATTTTSDYWLQDTTDTNKYTLTKTDDKEETLFTLSGVANTTDIAVSEEKVVTAANANIAAGAETVAVTGDYTLNLTDVVTEGTTEHTYKFSDVADNKATYVDTATTNAFWTKADDSKSYAFTAEKSEDTNLFELSGVANTTDIAVSEEKVVTAANANIAEGAETVAVTGDYTLNLTDVVTEGTTEHTYKFSDVADNKATYVDTATTNAFWTKADDSKSYAFTAEKIEDTNLFELSGVANTTDITVDDKKVVTAANANIAEGAETVAVTGDYTLSLTDVETEGKTEHTYKFSEVADNKATYVDTATTNAFWTKAEDSKSYALTAEKVEDTNLFELSGVANTTDVAVTEIKEDETVTGHKVVLTSANVATDAKEISLTGTNNVLELSGDDLPTAPVYGDTTKDFGDVDDTAHTVKYIATTEGKNYWLQDTSDKNKYTLTKADDKEETLFTLSGVKSKEGITVGEDGTVTITSASLIDQDTPVTIDADGYKLAIGDGIDKVEDVPASYKDSVYSAKGKSAGYSVSSDGKTLSYSDTTVKSFTFEGVADDANDSSFYYVSGDTITVGLTAVKTDGTAVTLKEASDGGSYKLKLGKGMSAPASVKATYADNVYTTAGKSAGYNLSDDKQSISYSESDVTSFTFEGVADGAEAGNFYLSGSTMTIGQPAVNTDGTTLTLKEASDGKDYTLKLGDGMTAATVYDAATYDAKSMTYNTEGATAGYILSNGDKSISYNAEDTTTAFKFSGVAEGAEAANFYLKDNVMTIGLAAVNTDGTALTLTEVSDGGEYTLKRGKGMTAGYTYDKATYDADKMTYNTAGTVAGYALSEDAKSISYNAETTSTTFKFSGVAEGAETSNFYLKDNVMTIGLAAVNTDGTALTLTNVSDGGEYTLKRGKGMTAGYTYDKATYNASNMTYNTAGTVEGYALSDDAKSISYNAETTATTFKFSGVAEGAETANFYLKGNVMTIGQAAVKTDGTALTLKSVSDEGDYTLKLGKGMTAATVYDAATYNAKSMTYNTKGATAGYALSSDAQSIAYNETATTTTFQFSGVADGAETSNFYLKDNVMTIGLAAVKTDGTALTLDSVSDEGEYTLKRGKGMTAAYTYDKATYDASKMTYNTAGTTAGYLLSEDAKSISYNETATSDTFKFSGIAEDADESAFYVNAKNKTITIGKAAVRLDGTAVTLKNAPDDEYVLKLGKGMSEATTETQTALDSGTFTVNEVTEGYALSDDKKSIAYDATADTKLELTGVSSEPTISDKQVAVTTATFDSELVVANNTGEYTFSVASGDYSGKIFTGSGNDDTITAQGDGISINGGAGNDSIKSSGLNVSINGGAGDDSILGGAGDEYFTGFNGNDYLHGGAGADTLNGGGGDDTLFGAAGDDSLNGGAGNDSMLGGNGNDQLLGGSGDDYLSGGAGNDVLRAGAGTDTLWGGAGNDKLYGGDGVDTFIYRPNEGTDSIYNYTSGEDLLQIVDADGNDVNFTKSTFNSSKGTLALDIDGGGKVYFGGVTASDTFDINGKTYEISGSKLVEK